MKKKKKQNIRKSQMIWKKIEKKIEQKNQEGEAKISRRTVRKGEGKNG